MSLLGRLIGKTPPKVPAGGRAFASQDDTAGHVWSVRVALGDEDPTPQCKRISPVFTLQTTAYAYLDWVTGEAASFTYPSGKA